MEVNRGGTGPPPWSCMAQFHGGLHMRSGGSPPWRSAVEVRRGPPLWTSSEVRRTSRFYLHDLPYKTKVRRTSGEVRRTSPEVQEKGPGEKVPEKGPPDLR